MGIVITTLLLAIPAIALVTGTLPQPARVSLARLSNPPPGAGPAFRGVRF
jgi:hypothetical protein